MSDVNSESERRETGGGFSPIPIVHLLYAVALPASSTAAFGTAGIPTAAVILGVWASVFYSRSRPKALRHACLVILCLFVLAALFLPTTQQAREAMRRVSCRNNMRSIGFALQCYASLKSPFPSAYATDENGRPMHSWRVSVLPFLEAAPLYEAYDFDEPWDGPNNRKLIGRMPDVFKCPTTGTDGFTSYVAVVGPRTCWPDSQGRSIEDITDGASNTIQLIEWNSGEIPWMEPRDISLEEAVDLLSSTEAQTAGGHRYETFFYKFYPGRNVIFADGHVRVIPHGLDPELALALLTVDDGGPDPDWDVVGMGVEPHRQLKVGPAFRVGLFLFLTVLPLPWVWLNPTSEHKRVTDE